MSISEPPPSSAKFPRRHDSAIGEVTRLLRNGEEPRIRARQMELILLAVLHAERITTWHRPPPCASHDLRFELDGQRFVLGCSWENDAMSRPAVELMFEGRAEGTPVAICMSGYREGVLLPDYVLLSQNDLMSVLEGRLTFRDMVATSLPSMPVSVVRPSATFGRVVKPAN
jgi:hypothetical protein